MREMPLADLLAQYAPGSHDQPWTWDDEERELHAFPDHEGVAGGYQKRLEAYVATNGISQGVCLGNDGRVWDGHHRIVAARRLGIDTVPLEEF